MLLLLSDSQVTQCPTGAWQRHQQLVLYIRRQIPPKVERSNLVDQSFESCGDWNSGEEDLKDNY